MIEISYDIIALVSCPDQIISHSYAHVRQLHFVTISNLWRLSTSVSLLLNRNLKNNEIFFIYLTVQSFFIQEWSEIGLPLRTLHNSNIRV